MVMEGLEPSALMRASSSRPEVTNDICKALDDISQMISHVSWGHLSNNDRALKGSARN
jgi:hypothetical protein